MSWITQKVTAFVAGTDFYDKASLWNRQRLNDIANTFKTAPFGGSRSMGWQESGTFNIPEWDDIELDGVLLSGFQVRARFDLRVENASVAVTPEVYDVTNSSVLATGTPMNSTTWTKQSISMTLPAASRFFRARLTASNADYQVFGRAYLEIKNP
jgi:hypothetical protein